MTSSAPSVDDTAALDDPVGSSLRGHHAHLARRRGRAVAYTGTVATFTAVPLDAKAQDWSDLAALVGRAGLVDLFSSDAAPPDDWEPVFRVPGLQLTADPTLFVAAGADPGSDVALATLDDADVPDMLQLTARTRPGPFYAETPRLGTYLGVREHGRLVAMAGERLRPPGWTEISAVCTAPEVRGRGLAARLVVELGRRIVARGERPFLHAAADNTGALALYQRLGFRVRREVTFHGYRVP